jgi:hypothetical protein
VIVWYVVNTLPVTNPAYVLLLIARQEAAKRCLAHLPQIASTPISVLWAASTQAAVINVFSQIALPVLSTPVVRKTLLALSRPAIAKVA